MILSTCKQHLPVAAPVALLTALLAALTGCAATPAPDPVIEVRTVNVAVPVSCTAPMPARPDMPTDTLRPGAPLDDVIAAALAEIDLREGYEGELRAALRGCVTP